MLLLTALIVHPVAYIFGMWIGAERDLDEARKEKGDVETELKILEGIYEAEHEVFEKTKEDLAKAWIRIPELETQGHQLLAQIDVLNKQIKDEQAAAARVAAISSTPPSQRGADFWRRLANCENASGNAPGGYFQFMGSTRTKVGWVPGLSYERQREMAIWWAEQIHPREGTISGWPNCWWVALRG